MRDLSVLIPSRNEIFLAKTIENILENIEADTEVICVLDGEWADPPVEDSPRVRVVHSGESIGQRAATNLAARMSTAKYVMKLDAHCALGKGFDRILMEDCEYDVTMVPRQYNLYAFDWKCKGCGHQRIYGPKPVTCEKCQASDFEMVVIWLPRDGRGWQCQTCWQIMRQTKEPSECACGGKSFKSLGHRVTDSWRFDSELHFQYWGELATRQGDKPIIETMSLLGACWFLHRERYWELGGCDEATGSWGQQGTEMACKAWLSGGRLLTNRKTWFAHLFRTQENFKFPYPLSHSQTEHARNYSKDMWRNGKWPKAKHSLRWLVEKFSPVPGWEDYDWGDSKPLPQAKGLSKGIIYYTDNQCPEPVYSAVQTQLRRAADGIPIVSASLQPIEFGKNVVVNRQRSILTMNYQILAALEASTADIIYFCEHDVLYAKEHFQFIPPRTDAFYYDVSTWKVNAETGHAITYRCKQTSGLCGYRDLLVEHYRKRIAKIEQNAHDLRLRGEPIKNEGFSRHMGHEPGCHAPPRGVDNYPALEWCSEVPNVDIRHGKNLTRTRWRQEDFRDKNSCTEWGESDSIPSWGRTEGRFLEFLRELIN